MSRKKGPKDFFSMINRSLWRSTRFCGLSLQEQHLLLFFMTCGHANHIGCFHLPDQYALADLNKCRDNWSMAEYRLARDSLIAAEMIDFDPETDEILIERWIKKNPPAAPNNFVNMERSIEAIESARLAEKLHEQLAANKPELEDPLVSSLNRRSANLQSWRERA